MSSLVERAMRSDASVLPRIRALLDRHPEIWSHVGDAARYVEAAWLDRMAGDDALVRESILRQADQLRQDLAGPHATRAEQMLVDLAVNNWLEVQYSQYVLAAAAGGSIMQANHRLRKGESAQKKFLGALKALATLRAVLPEGLAPSNSLRVYREEEERRPA